MEGPSLVILREAVKSFRHKKIIKAAGTTVSVEPATLQGQTILDFKTYGKHFLIVFKKFSLRIHFLMFGSYRINERKLAKPRLSLQFARGEINFYTCAITKLEEDLDTLYDWSADVMNEKWNAVKARKKIKKNPEATVSDVLLDQNIFAGVGNIIKNEVLFRIKVHPETEGRRNAWTEAVAVNYGSQKLQLRFLPMEKSLRAEEALAHLRKKEMS